MERGVRGCARTWMARVGLRKECVAVVLQKVQRCLFWLAAKERASERGTNTLASCTSWARIRGVHTRAHACTRASALHPPSSVTAVRAPRGGGGCSPIRRGRRCWGVARAPPVNPASWCEGGAALPRPTHRAGWGRAPRDRKAKHPAPPPPCPCVTTGSGRGA